MAVRRSYVSLGYAAGTLFILHPPEGFVNRSEMLDGNGFVSGEEVCLPAMAGEQEDLPVFRLRPEPPESGGAAAVVKGGQGVVQNDGDGGFPGQDQIADS